MIEAHKVLYGSVEVSRVKGLLFNVDGTLRDTDDHMVERVIRLLKPFRWLFKNRNPQHFARWVVMGMETPANLIYGLADKLGLDGLFSKFYSQRAKRRHTKQPLDRRFLIIDGVEDMLMQLTGRFIMGIVSARDASTTLYFLEHFDLQKYFSVVVTAQSCKHSKPYPDPVEFAAKALGLTPDTCIMIGDTTVDMRAGKAAGAQTIGVLCGFGTRRELIKTGANLIVQNTPDITALLIET
jgi:HAD superfamily hydrolase (TIGR01509 family)